MTYNKETLKEAIVQKLRLNYGCTEKQATDGEMMKACAMVLRDIMAERGVQTRENTTREEKRKVHYLSLEFLMGRSLMKNAFNLELLGALNEAIDELGFKAADIFEMEPDAGLGNGGLGRLAACYLDSMTTLEIPAAGYSICYELGIFKQKIVEGQQVELPDDWMQLGDAWLLPKLQEAEEVHFGGTVRTRWDNGHLMVVHEDYTRVLAVPCDMEIAGYDTDHVNTLRLWQARSPKPIDMKLFSQGQYLHAAEERAMADAISQVLYPEDNHYEGKSLRLKQQYFFVSATIQSIVRKHIQQYGTVKNFHEKNVIQINDTHPTLVIPELMRILVDDAGMDWDEAWHIVTHCVAYTNHTVMAEALEVWPQQLFETLLPRVWQILQEIARRWQQQVEDFYHDPAKTAKLAIIWDGGVRMANLCIAGSMAVNGVSALHSEILRKDLFKDACQMQPDKFKNVTNGIDHRRWVSQINPGLDSLIRDLTGGDGYLTHPMELKKLEQYVGDTSVLARLDDIKKANKQAFADFAKKQQGVVLNTDAIFDVQVKRLHEYKRQLLNVLYILTLYNKIKDHPEKPVFPQTFIFAAKASAGYYLAKQIISLIVAVSNLVNSDPQVQNKFKVVFIEDYKVSLAEIIIPAADLSEQISVAGKEASGTSNMKLMINGAVTLGTLDGANVEIRERVGDENMFLFGMTADEVQALWQRGYDPRQFLTPELDRVLQMLTSGVLGQRFDDVAASLLTPRFGAADSYMTVADFASYKAAKAHAVEIYQDRTRFAKMSLTNIARAGIFSSDRSVKQYAKEIWNL